MITLNIKLKQFLEIEDLNIDDDDALEDLSDFDPEIVTSDLGEAEVSGSCQVSIIDNPKTAVRDLDLTISLHDDEQAKSFVSEDMDISEDFSDMDYLAFLRYYLGSTLRKLNNPYLKSLLKYPYPHLQKILLVRHHANLLLSLNL